MLQQRSVATGRHKAYSAICNKSPASVLITLSSVDCRAATDGH